ncbi:translation initiation factor IF-2 subunit gamma [Candidatus Pacearchaeota archaeon]|nr:translation initiation factor IF-2 subunit gamma [Candidatus Pacearchaeota archaeon]
MTKEKTQAQSEDIEKLPMLNVGTVGHIDHGKTTLLYKLTGKFADTHSEELKRGITIKLGYAETILEGTNAQGKPEKRYISFVDAPGHEMLMATMLSGAAMLDAAILVIAANEGIKPQTREHLIALKAKNVKNIIIVQNKIDLVTSEQAMASYKDIKEFVKGTIAENAPIIPVSAQQNINLNLIKKKLLSIEIPKRDTQGKPLFLIARSFDINKPGTSLEKIHGGIIAGVLKQGTIKVGDEIEIKPGSYEKKANQFIYQTLKTKIISIHRGNHTINEATPGGSLAMETELDNILTKTDSLAGCIASKAGELPEIIDKIKIKFNLFEKVFGTNEETKVEQLKPSELLMLSVNTGITVGMIKTIKGNEADVHLRIPIVPIKSDNIGIARNINNHWRLIGYAELVSNPK